MKFLVGIITVSTILFITSEKEAEKSVAHFVIADTIRTEIIANYDSLGFVANYRARIFTPVCEVDKCYAIEVFFYWDLIGRFDHYDTIPQSGLTKLDHIPFSDSDYSKLHQILRNPGSPLASYSKEELVQNTRSSEIDGLTGATINEIKETVIEGAVYSCHALWHIAHGAAVDSIQQVTKKNWSIEFVGKLVSLQDQEINYFLITNFSDEDFEKYLPEILETILTGQAYYAKNVIEKMPAALISSKLAQHFFVTNFTQLNYFAQVALLKKLDRKFLTQELSEVLKEELDDRNSYKSDLIQQLLEEDDKH